MARNLLFSDDDTNIKLYDRMFFYFILFLVIAGCATALVIEYRNRNKDNSKNSNTTKNSNDSKNEDNKTKIGTVGIVILSVLGVIFLFGLLKLGGMAKNKVSELYQGLHTHEYNYEDINIQIPSSQTDDFKELNNLLWAIRNDITDKNPWLKKKADKLYDELGNLISNEKWDDASKKETKILNLLIPTNQDLRREYLILQDKVNELRIKYKIHEYFQKGGLTYIQNSSGQNVVDEDLKIDPKFQKTKIISEYKDKQGNKYNIYDTKGDGNCFWHALNHSLGSTLGWKNLKALSFYKMINNTDIDVARLRDLYKDGKYFAISEVEKVAEALGIKITIIDANGGNDARPEIKTYNENGSGNYHIHYNGNNHFSAAEPVP